MPHGRVMCDCEHPRETAVENIENGATHRLAVVCQACGDPVRFVDE
jgi:hypothetical protein